MVGPTATTALALALCGWLVLPPAGGASGDDMPQPEAGQAAVTTLALVQYSRDQCDRIAASERPHDFDYSHRQQAIAVFQRSGRTGVQAQFAAHLEYTREPLLARRGRRDRQRSRP